MANVDPRVKRQVVDNPYDLSLPVLYIVCASFQHSAAHGRMLGHFALLSG